MPLGLERAGQELELDAGRVEQVEERLFALRRGAQAPGGGG